MSFPSEVTTRILVHRYLDPDSGDPCSGTVELRPSNVMMYPGGTIIKSTIRADIDPLTGDVSIEAPDNYNPLINPQGTSYMLYENPIAPNDPGGLQHWVRANRIRIPAGVGEINIDQLIPVPEDDPGETPIIRGPKGDPGLPGVPGGTVIEWDQTTPAATWSIPHTHGPAPKVVLVMDGDDGPSWTDTSFQTGLVILEFPDPQTGKAYIS